MQKLIYIISFFLLCSCTKDKVPPPGSCIELDYTGFPPISYISHPGEQFTAPCVNPNNENEFVYYYRDNDNEVFKLITYNVLTKEKIELIPNIKLVGSPKWGVKGRIAFSNFADYQIWAIKDNGDSLTRISENSACIHPAWSSDGNALYYQYSPVLGIPYYLLRKTVSVSQPDTLYYSSTEYNDISNNGKLVSVVYINNQMHLAYTDINTIDYIPLLNLQANKLVSITGLCWSADEKSVYFSVAGEGIYKLDIQSKTYIKLVDPCNSRYYNSLSASPNNVDLIVERVDRTLGKYPAGNYNGDVIEKSTIWKINTLTLEETKIDLK